MKKIMSEILIEKALNKMVATDKENSDFSSTIEYKMPFVVFTCEKCGHIHESCEPIVYELSNSKTEK